MHVFIWILLQKFIQRSELQLRRWYSIGCRVQMHGITFSPCFLTNVTIPPFSLYFHHFQPAMHHISVASVPISHQPNPSGPFLSPPKPHNLAVTVNIQWTCF